MFNSAGQWRQPTTTNPGASSDTFVLILFSERSCPLRTTLRSAVPGIVLLQATLTGLTVTESLWSDFLLRIFLILLVRNGATL